MLNTSKRSERDMPYNYRGTFYATDACILKRRLRHVENLQLESSLGAMLDCEPG